MVHLSLFSPKGNQAARYFPYHGYLGLTPIKVEGGLSRFQLILCICKHSNILSQSCVQRQMTMVNCSLQRASLSLSVVTSHGSDASMPYSRMCLWTTHKYFGRNPRGESGMTSGTRNIHFESLSLQKSPVTALPTSRTTESGGVSKPVCLFFKFGVVD
jgi:hypothetical protein